MCVGLMCSILLFILSSCQDCFIRINDVLLNYTHEEVLEFPSSCLFIVRIFHIQLLFPF